MASVGTTDLRELLIHLWHMSRVNRYCPLMIWGEAGIGKSDSVRTASDELGIDFIDLRLANMDAPDLMGLMRDDQVFPCLFDLQDPERNPLVTGERYSRTGLWHHCKVKHPDKIPPELQDRPSEFVEWLIEVTQKAGYGVYIETRTVYSAPSWFPEPDTAGILFLDEANRSSRETRQGVFQLLLDRRIHELELPAGWIIVSAGNPKGAMVTEAFEPYGDAEEITDRAFLARMCHVVLSTSRDEWLEWAARKRLDQTIRVLITNDPSDKLLGLKHGLQIPAVDPTPRSWELLSGLLAPVVVGNEPQRELRGRLRQVVAEGMLGTACGAKVAEWLDEVDGARDGGILRPEVIEALLESALDRATLEHPGSDDAAYLLEMLNKAVAFGQVDLAVRYARMFQTPQMTSAIRAGGWTQSLARDRGLEWLQGQWR